MHFLKEKLKSFVFWLLTKSLKAALREQNYSCLEKELRNIVPSLKDQYSSFVIEGDYLESKVYGQHSFQVALTQDAINRLQENDKNTVIGDIGDSSGTHITYLQNLNKNVDAMSINSDPLAVKKIKTKGLQAFLSRAEELHFHPDFNKEMDILISFEMLEHLKNPLDFLETMAKESQCKNFVITVPLVKRSRVALDKLKNMDSPQAFNPEVTHIFELSPNDWDKLFKFSGWKIVKRIEYYQFPKYHPLGFTKYIWKKLDFEGFYGVILEKDDTYSSQYLEY